MDTAQPPRQFCAINYLGGQRGPFRGETFIVLRGWRRPGKANSEGDRGEDRRAFRQTSRSMEDTHRTLNPFSRRHKLTSPLSIEPQYIRYIIGGGDLVTDPQSVIYCQPALISQAAIDIGPLTQGGSP